MNDSTASLTLIPSLDHALAGTPREALVHCVGADVGADPARWPKAVQQAIGQLERTFRARVGLDPDSPMMMADAAQLKNEPPSMLPGHVVHGQAPASPLSRAPRDDRAQIISIRHACVPWLGQWWCVKEFHYRPRLAAEQACPATAAAGQADGGPATPPSTPKRGAAASLATARAP